jgi:hypothetical protein
LPAWAWPAAALAILAVSLSPFLVVDAPAVLDYPNHLARFYILAHLRDPILSRMYATHWTLLPNIGMDVLGTALLSALPPDIGGRILLALSLVAPPAGAILYARAAFGRWTWWSLGAAVVAYNGIFFLGFMNFLLSVGVAFASAAGWRVLRRQGRDRAAVAAGAALGLASFLCHLLGFGLFALLIVAQELGELAPFWRRREATWRAAIHPAILLATSLAPTTALYLTTRQPTDNGQTAGWNWGAKFTEWLIPFMSYSTLATVITAAVVIGAVAIVWRRGGRLAAGVGTALVVVGGLYIVAPAAAAGGTFVDARLPLIGALLLFAGLDPRPPPGVARAVAVGLALLLVGRAAVVTQSWIGHARDLAELRADLAYVPPGATILPAWTGSPADEETSGRELPHFTLLNDELAAFAIIERRAFWPLEFADPAQQPIVLRAPYDSLGQRIGWPAQWVRLLDNPSTSAEVAEHPFLKDWRGRFDFVLLTGPPPAGPMPVGLVLLRRGDETSIYKVLR